MFIYYDYRCPGPNTLAWFKAEGRSLHLVLSLLQRGDIIRECINVLGHTLLVSFTNSNLWKFTDGDYYHLYLEKDTADYMNISIPFVKGSFVCDIYRPVIDDITLETWKNVFGDTISYKTILDEETEYSDFIEESDSDVEYNPVLDYDSESDEPPISEDDLEPLLEEMEDIELTDVEFFDTKNKSIILEP